MMPVGTQSIRMLAAGLVAMAALAAPAKAQVEPIGPLLAAADPAAGTAVSRRCLACHTFDDGGANRVGPNLYNIVNKDIAATEGYAYSEAMAAKEGVWDYETLNTYLANPRQAVAGTKMTFAGLPNAQDRANIIAYLRSLSAEPAPLP